MAKKVVATLKTGTGKNFTKVIKMVKSDKTGAYAFKSDIVPNDRVKGFFEKKWYGGLFVWYLPNRSKAKKARPEDSGRAFCAVPADMTLFIRTDIPN